MIDAVFFDFDGVLRHFPSSRVPEIERSAGLPDGAIRATAFADDLLIRATTGTITDEEWRSEIAKRLASAHPRSSAIEAVREWSAPLGSIDDEMLEIIRSCRARCRVGLISNATTRFSGDMDGLGVAGEFDVIVSSAAIGAVKPGRAIFEFAVASLETTLSNSIFIDDSRGHVEAAVSFGMRGVVHTSNAETRSELAALGVL